MNLRKFDNKCVEIKDIFGDIYEGICQFNDKEYNEHEFGKYEESLQMPGIMFYQSIIKQVKILKDNHGPYGKFSSKYGKLEEITVESGIDMIEEVFASEENIHVYRLLLYINDKLDTFTMEDKKKLIKLLETLIKYNDDNKIVELAKNIEEFLENKIIPYH